MSKKKLKIAVLFGGKSAEHEVSVMSAKNVIAGLDKNKYDIAPIKIPKHGKFDVDNLKKFDVVFPVMHGPYGEDGSIQGLLKICEVPFVGAGVLGGAVGMDKDVMKRLLKASGIPVGKFLVFKSKEAISFKEIKKQLGLPVFVKPANLGSSVGVSKAKNEQELMLAVDEAFQYDSKIIIEEFIKGREIECSVLGNDEPMASLPGEIIASQEFYSYDAKYTDQRSRVEIPAKLKPGIVKKVQELAVKTFEVLACQGLGRVDFFVTDSGRVLVNEINTIPGFTNISMYPKLWEASGVPLSEVLDTLILLAIERFEKEQKLKTTF